MSEQKHWVRTSRNRMEEDGQKNERKKVPLAFNIISPNIDKGTKYSMFPMMRIKRKTDKVSVTPRVAYDSLISHDSYHYQNTDIELENEKGTHYKNIHELGHKKYNTVDHT